MFSTLCRSVGKRVTTIHPNMVRVTVCQVKTISSVDSKPQKISKNLSFRQSDCGNNERPLVILYGWLVAKAKHIYKYGDFYLGKGFDVLNVKIQPGQLLRPATTQTVITQILDFVSDHEHKQKPLLVHGFSVGGYLYGETLVKIHNTSKYESVGERIQGQIFDSPADLESIPYGTSRAVTPIPVLQNAIHKTLQGYLNVFEKSVTRHYRASSNAFHDNKLRAPSLFLYSNADPVGLAGPIETVIAKMKSKDIDVFHKIFDGSRHVSHFHHYPIEYVGELNRFLEYLKLDNSVEDKSQEDSRIIQ